MCVWVEEAAEIGHNRLTFGQIGRTYSANKLVKFTQFTRGAYVQRSTYARNILYIHPLLPISRISHSGTRVAVNVCGLCPIHKFRICVRLCVRTCIHFRSLHFPHMTIGRIYAQTHTYTLQHTHARSCACAYGRTRVLYYVHMQYSLSFGGGSVRHGERALARSVVPMRARMLAITRVKMCRVYARCACAGDTN